MFEGVLLVRMIPNIMGVNGFSYHLQFLELEFFRTGRNFFPGSRPIWNFAYISMFIHATCLPFFGFREFFVRKKTALEKHGIFSHSGFLKRVVKPELAKNGQNVFIFTPLIVFLPYLSILGYVNVLPVGFDLLHFRSRNLESVWSEEDEIFHVGRQWSLLWVCQILSRSDNFKG